MRLFMHKPEVVGQMLDSAANAVAYWQAGTIAMTFAPPAPQPEQLRKKRR